MDDLECGDGQKYGSRIWTLSAKCEDFHTSPARILQPLGARVELHAEGLSQVRRTVDLARGHRPMTLRTSGAAASPLASRRGPGAGPPRRNRHQQPRRNRHQPAMGSCTYTRAPGDVRLTFTHPHPIRRPVARAPALRGWSCTRPRGRVLICADLLPSAHASCGLSYPPELRKMTAPRHT